MDGHDAIGKGRGTRLENHRRLDLVEFPFANGGDLRPAWPLGDAGGTKLLSAPGPDNDIRRPAHDLQRVRNNAVAPQWSTCQLAKAVFPAGDSDELRDPADTRYQGIVPFLEVDTRAARKPGCRLADAGQSALELVHKSLGRSGGTHHASQRENHREDLVDAPVIEDMHVRAPANEFRRDVRLQVRKPEDQIRRQIQDPVDPGAGEG